MTTDYRCSNVLDDSFFNKCRREEDAGFFTITAEFVAQFLNPRQQAITTIFIVLALPLLSRNGKQSMLLLKLQVLHFLHRLSYSLILVVGLYAVFRQQRPCICNNVRIGSRYGMPSGDAIAGALLGVWLFMEAPYNKIVSRIVGVLIPILVCVERMTLGYHTLGQVVTGTSLGIVLHIYSTNVPLAFVFVDAAVSTIMGTISLHADTSLVYEENTMNNLWAWFLWGLAFEAFAILMFIRLREDLPNKQKWLKKSLKEWLEELRRGGGTLSPLLGEESSEEKSDVKFMFLSICVFILVNYLSYWVSRYGWMTKTS